MRLNERPPMTNITKAAQDALDALEVRCGTCAEERQPGGVIDALRAALQDKACEVADFQSRSMFVARLENMQANGDAWLTVPAVLALLNDCDMIAAAHQKGDPV